MELFDLIEFEAYALESLSSRRRQGIVESNFALGDETHDQRAKTPTQSSVGRTVHPNWKMGSSNLMGIPEDVTIVSLDLVRFHAHQACLLAASSNLFNGLMPIIGNVLQQHEPRQDTVEASSKDEHGLDIINLPEVAPVINVLLFAAYNRMPSTSILDVSSTSLSDLRLAVAALKTYGIPVQGSLAETSLVFAIFASYCPIAALQVYTIAASNAPDMHAVAVYASQFLLSLDLSIITDEMADEMGPLYVQKLFSLHLERVQEFKRLIVRLPRPHRSSPHCKDTNGVALREAWAYASAYLSWLVTPSTPNTVLDEAVASVMDKVACNDCKDSLRKHCLSLKQQWSLVKKTV